MDPNEGKEYPRQYISGMQYGGDFAGYISSDYPSVPPQSMGGMPMGGAPPIRTPYYSQPQPQVQYPSAQPQVPGQSMKIKGKRRSKNETEGRNYKCNQCERTYLSYPALYTHIKTKHSVQGEAPMTSGRGRGRPKKNLAKEERADPTSMLYFRTEEHKGGPTAVLYRFEDAYNILFENSTKYKSFTEHKLYFELYKRHLRNVATLNYAHEHPGTSDFGPTPIGLPVAVYVLKNEEPPKPSEDASEAKDNSSPEINSPEKKQKKCDEVFSEYLDIVAKEVNKSCYAEVLKFVFLFRECLNHYGEKLVKGRNEDGGPEYIKNNESKEDYCLTHNPEQAPEISNEFVTVYLDEVKATFGSMDSIELTQNFCGWLFGNGYTCSKLSLIQDNQ